MTNFNEDDIEIIGANRSTSPTPLPEPRRPRRQHWWLLLAAVAVCAIGAILWPLLTKNSDEGIESPSTPDPTQTASATEEISYEEPEGIYESESITEASVAKTQQQSDITGCVVTEVTSSGRQFRQLMPHGASPSLHVGPLNFNDTSIILALQAADIRKDNKQVVGACVHQGQLISRGLSKQGFCAIIHGAMTVGVSSESPLLERAIETNGDFFRQYPLVDEGKACKSNLQAESIRRALCQRGSETFVIESLSPISMQDFSQTLVEMHITNAIYLVGSAYACGILKTPDGERQQWGHNEYARAKNVTYLVWR